jgi:hypothetical protein
MKKILFVSILLLTFNFVKAQNEVLFKVKYLPSHTYQFNGGGTFAVQTDLSSNKEIASKLAAQGITQPINAVIQFDIKGKTTTYTINADKVIPLIMNFSTPTISGTVNGKPIPIPSKSANSIIYGHVDANGNLNVDSLNGKKLNDSASNEAKSMMNKMMGLVNFPEQPLKIGGSFTRDIPFNFPMAKGMALNIKITYKLISISNGKAYLDLVPDLNMKMQIKQMGLTITGTGAGKMVYDIKNSFPLSQTTDIFMTINLQSEKFSASGTAKVTGTSTYIIN